MDPLGRGRRRLEAKDYTGAVEAFTETMNISSSHLLVPALEGRIRAYVKMDELKLALKDAREMIEKAPQKAKGYLVAGDICKLMKQDEKALLIYEMGLTKVRIGTDENRPKLQESMASLRKKLRKDTDIDRLTPLPAELLYMILSYLSLSDIVRCLSLSKRMNALIEGEKRIWKELDLSTTKRSVPTKSLLHFFKRSDFTLNKAIIKMFPHNHGATIRTVTNKCKQLEYLSVTASFSGASIGTSVLDNLPMAKNLKTLILSKNCAVSLRMVSKMLQACQTLCVAEFHNVDHANQNANWTAELPCLTNLVLKHIHDPKDHNRFSHSWERLGLDSLIPCTPNLIVGRFEGLDFGSYTMPSRVPCFRGWKTLEVLSLKDTGLDFMPMLPQSLVCLDLSGHHRGNFSFANLENIADRTGESSEKDLRDPKSCNLPNLEEFYINNSDSIGPALFEFLIRASIAAGKLRIMDVTGHDFPPGIYPRCDSLVGLSLAKISHWDEDQILRTVLRYPNVRELDLSETKVTGYALKRMLTRGMPLRKVVLHRCFYVSPDTFEYLEKKGIVVVQGW